MNGRYMYSHGRFRILLLASPGQFSLVDEFSAMKRVTDMVRHVSKPFWLLPLPPSYQDLWRFMNCEQWSQVTVICEL